MELALLLHAMYMGKFYRIVYDVRVVISNFLVSASEVASGSGEWKRRAML